jgi:hypothetical protein
MRELSMDLTFPYAIIPLSCYYQPQDYEFFIVIYDAHE